MPDTQSRYDEIPYQSGSVSQAHPQYLAALGVLFGMQPPNVERCRVLELGCAEGGNLIPLAADLPESRFVGVDLSPRQIAEGQAVVRDAGLSNIELRTADICEFEPSSGPFDYIIAHGVYSWVPEPVRDRVLAICRDHLAEQGIAFISYNAMPGGHIRRMVREMLFYHGRRFPDVPAQLHESRRLLDFLIAAVPEQQSAYRQVLEWERDHVRRCADHQLHHDLLADVNDPVWVAQFVDHAERHGMQYVGDADFPSMLPRNFPPDVFEGLKHLSRSAVDVEQFMDFARNRVFRQTLLCRKEVRLSRRIDPGVISRLHVASSLSKVDAPTNDAGRTTRFRHPDGGEIKTGEPVAVAAYAFLRERWPGNAGFAELLEQSRRRCASTQTVERDSAALCESLMTCFSNRLIELSARLTSCTATIGRRPAASVLARRQAVRGSVAVNLRHETVKLRPVQRFVLQHLDGGQSRESLAEQLWNASRTGALRVDLDAHALPTPHFQKDEADAQVTNALRDLAQSGFLMDWTD
ncbi:MAG: methyltransferase regulatory domain-containing protein [Planctomycetaceae bacterium]